MNTDKTSLTKKEKEYPSSKRSFIGDINEDALFADGFDDAIIGYDAIGFRVVYDYDKCLKVLMLWENMSHAEAHEYMEFNVVNSFVGDFTPLFLHSL